MNEFINIFKESEEILGKFQQKAITAKLARNELLYMISKSESIEEYRAARRAYNEVELARILSPDFFHGSCAVRILGIF